VIDVTTAWERRYCHVTRVNRHGALRRILRWLWEEHGAPKLDTYVPRLTGTRPRNVTADRASIDRILTAARPDMRLWLLLCSDLGIRSGTALRLAPDNYNQRAGTLSFTTKKAAALTLPVTADVAEYLDSCDLTSPQPFVTQLRVRAVGNMGRPRRNREVNSHNMRQEYATLRRSLGITKRITPHDLRRTTAVAVYKHTRDLHIVQSFLGHRNMQATIWYLDHDLQPLDRAILEDAKKPFIAWRKEQSA
jgi:integrase